MAGFQRLLDEETSINTSLLCHFGMIKQRNMQENGLFKHFFSIINVPSFVKLGKWLFWKSFIYKESLYNTEELIDAPFLILS